MQRIQIARMVFLMNLNIMKKILDLGKYKLGKDSSEFLYYKQQVMSFFYDDLKKQFKKMIEEKLLKKCPEKCNLRQGFKKCLCGGSGYINYDEI